MDWKPLNSGHLQAAAYDEESGILSVQFHQGRKYSYEGINQRTADLLFGSEHPGRFFHQAIRKYYQGTEVTEE